MYNKLLQRQIQKHFGHPHALPPEVLPVFNVISNAYDHYEKDRRMLERSIELSSEEMIELNNNLRTEKEELRSALKHLKLLFENVNELLFSVDMISRQVIRMADVCENIYGYPATAFFADPSLWETVIYPDDKYIPQKGLLQLAKGQPVFDQYRIVHRDGSIRWLDNKIYPTLDEAGNLVRIDGVSSDITERKNAELELAKSVSLLEATLEATADGILVADVKGKIVSYNKKFQQLWKIPSEIVAEGSDEMAIGFVLEQLIDADGFLNKVKELYTRPAEVSFDVLHFKDGRVFERYSQPQLIDGAYVGRVWSFRDVTVRKRAEETLRLSEATLERNNRELAQKNKELEQFAYVASHDLQEPVRTVSSFVELLKKEYGGRFDANADKYINFMLQASDRMKVLIQDLLDYSRIGRKTSLAHVDCNTVMAGVLQDVGTAIKEADAIIETDPLPVINGYPTELKQLFQNLVINAVKFRKKETRPHIHITAAAKNGYWEFCVADNGIGIDLRHSERIFDIFQRLHTRTEYEGSGIGLSHCKKIVELHGGRIWVVSTPGEGSAFYFTIHEYNDK